MNTNSRRLYKLLILLGIACATLMLFQHKEIFKKEKKTFSNRDMDRVTNITITNDAQKTEIYLRNNQWVIKNGAAKEEKLDKKKIDAFFTLLLGLNKSEIVSMNKSKYETFGITGKRMVELDLKNDLLHIPVIGSKKLMLFIGNREISVTYFRANTDPFVYTTANDLSSILTIR